jgi:hypothetical protein
MKRRAGGRNPTTTCRTAVYGLRSAGESGRSGSARGWVEAVSLGPVQRNDSRDREPFQNARRGAAAWLSLLAPVSGMTRPRAWAIIDAWIAGRRRVFSVAETVVALDWMLFHRLPGSIRGKRWVGLERKNEWCRVRGFLEKRSPRFVMLALCVHLIPRP